MKDFYKTLGLLSFTAIVSVCLNMYIGKAARDQQLDNFFELCYNNAIMVKENRAIGCFPMSPLSKEEKKELDKLTEV